IPAVLDPNVTARWRFAVPGIAGVAFGFMTVLHSLLAPGHTPVTPFPISILVFAAGGIMLEVLLRLVGITVPTALFGTLGPKARTAAFWVAAVVTSLYEPLPFIFDAVHGHASPLLIALRLFLFNLTGALFYRKAGLLSALSERWAEYGVWHIIGQSLFKLQ
ncbi:MAG TPA: hypothetical protein VJ901_22250, partial [Thermoanaerobaculia bacterium]|nr:hypothetical protein [Thermoanaerobaculia bacterium]